jgi:hypothetical protein
MFAHLDAFRPNGYYLPPKLTQQNYYPAWEALHGMTEKHADRPEVAGLAQDVWQVSVPPDQAKTRP